MTAARVSSPPPERRHSLLAVPSGEERDPERVRLAPTLVRELRRLDSHPLRELRRLEHEARAGENPATPAILMAGMAVAAWSLVALVVGLAFLLAHLLA